MGEFNRVREAVWEIPQTGGMRVPGKVIATEKLLNQIESGSIQQLKNVATLPGIQQASIAMPDMHWGYGFPIGGVAAMDYKSGVVSPGGIGFDINCGVRLIKTNLTEKELRPKLKELLDVLYENIPVGLRMGKRAKIALNKNQMNEVLQTGARWAVQQGYGWKKDLEKTEEKDVKSVRHLNLTRAYNAFLERKYEINNS